MPEKTGRARGGLAVAAKMTTEERKARAMKGVEAKRELSTLMKATYGSPDRPLRIGDATIPCYVLEDGTRVLTQFGFYEAIGRSGKPAQGRGASFENIAPFLALQNLKPFIDEELVDSTKPIKFLIDKGSVAWGFKAEILPKVCEVYLKARDAKALLKSQEKFAVACDLIIRGLAHIGIIALVDEVTGYQKDRAKDELSKILEAFVAKELQPWIKTFSVEYYEQIFRLRGLQFPGNGVKRPQYFGHLTNDIIYRRLAPGVWEELKHQTEKNEKGKLKHHLHRKLTPDLGHPKLRDLLTSVVTIMKLSNDWKDFKGKLDRIHTAYNDTMPLPFDLEDDTGKGI